MKLTTKRADQLRIGDQVVLHNGVSAAVIDLVSSHGSVTIVTAHLRVTWNGAATVPVARRAGR
jgi:preprotein translocase subunit YajC